MKNLKSSLLVKSLVLLFVIWLSSCSEDEEEPIIASENPIEADVITSAEELNALIVKEGGDLSQLNLEERMSFLSDYLASQYSSQASSLTARSGDEIVCVAQVFNGTTFFTDVEVGTDSQNVFANIVAPLSTSITFAGANANIYRNGVNIDGKITSANPSGLSCINSPGFLGVVGQSSASYRPTSLNTFVLIDCVED